MNLKAISRNVGYALLVSALFMLLALFVSWGTNDGAQTGLFISFLITFISGVFPFIFVRGVQPITIKDGYMIIVISWLLSFIFGMLPYALWGDPFTLANAWFESVSGFTATGATVIADVESLPPSLLFWRGATHFIGGLGVTVFLLLLIPTASPIRSRLTNMELSSLSKSSYSARSGKTVFIFTYVYLGIFVLSFVSYLLAGMQPLDAVCQAFSVSATGGFSTKNISILGFHSTLIEGLTMVFMLLSSLHFGLLFLSVVNRSLKPLNNPVLKFYLVAVFAVSIITGISLKFSGTIPSLGRALWCGAFQTISTVTTTGFAIADNAAFPMWTNVLLLAMAVMCGCAGSTSGGIKADRVFILFKTIGRQIGKTLHPNLVNEVKVGPRVLHEEEVTQYLLYIAFYGVMLVVSTVIALCLGLGAESAFSGSVVSLSNVGPAIGDIGSMGNYGAISNSAKFLFAFDMFLGRVEIYPIVAVVAMIFDRHRR